MQTVLANVCKDPYNEKFQKLKMANKKIAQFIGKNMECVNLLELLGFEEKHDVVSEDGSLQSVLLITAERAVDKL